MVKLDWHGFALSARRHAGLVAGLLAHEAAVLVEVDGVVAGAPEVDVDLVQGLVQVGVRHGLRVGHVVAAVVAHQDLLVTLLQHRAVVDDVLSEVLQVVLRVLRSEVGLFEVVQLVFRVLVQLLRLLQNHLFAVGRALGVLFFDDTWFAAFQLFFVDVVLYKIVENFFSFNFDFII